MRSLLYRYNKHWNNENSDAESEAKYYASLDKLHKNTIEFSDKKENDPAVYSIKQDNKMKSPKCLMNIEKNSHCKYFE